MTITGDTGSIINIAVIAFTVLAVVIGYKKGFLWQLLKILGILACILVAWILAPGLSELVHIIPESWTPFVASPLAGFFYEKLNSICWFIIVFLIGLLILVIIKPIFKSITNLPGLKTANKVIGAILALVPVFIVCLLVTFVLNSAIFTNGKDIVNGSILKYNNVIIEKGLTLFSGKLSENIAIQKIINDPLSLDKKDVEAIVKWLQESQVDGDTIYEFLKQYGIDITVLNGIFNK